RLQFTTFRQHRANGLDEPCLPLSACRCVSSFWHLLTGLSVGHPHLELSFFGANLYPGLFHCETMFRPERCSLGRRNLGAISLWDLLCQRIRVGFLSGCADVDPGNLGHACLSARDQADAM